MTHILYSNVTINELIPALCFWVGLVLLSCLLTVFIPFLVIGATIIRIYFTITNKTIPLVHPSPIELLCLENEIISSSCKCLITHIWKDITFDLAINDIKNIIVTVNTHALYVRCKSKHKDVPTLLIVHGNGSGSISWIECFDELSQHFHILALDLPGFGRSFSSFSPLTKTQTQDFYALFIAKFLESINLDTVYVLAHSYGGFLSIYFTRMFPEKVLHLALVNTAGILPTLSASGAYWAFVFKMSMLQSCRYLGKIGLFVFIAWFSVFNCDIRYLYWYYILSSPYGWGDKRLADFVTFKLTRAYWNLPAFEHMSNISQTVSVSTVWGELDKIMSSDQGKLLYDTFGIPYIIIDKSGHSPIHGSEALALCKAVVYQYGHVTVCHKINHNAHEFKNLFSLSNSWENKYYSTFSISHTMKNINILYNDIQNVKNRIKKKKDQNKS